MLVTCKKNFKLRQDLTVAFKKDEEYLFQVEGSVIMYTCVIDNRVKHYQITISDLKDYFSLVVF
jgi:hypothetical protein